MADTKKKIYIVGGKGKNVPPWISAAFNYEQFDQDHAKTRTLEPSNSPDAVVVLSSWVGHEHFYGARDLSERLGIPMILSPGGWSASLKSAADQGVEWFIKDIDRAKTSGDLSDSQVADVEDFIDNAWREAYNREWSAREGIERRYNKDRGKFEHAQRELARLREKEEAAQRVIAEVRAAAAAQRKATESAQAASERRTKAIAAAADEARNALERLRKSLSEDEA